VPKFMVFQILAKASTSISSRSRHDSSVSGSGSVSCRVFRVLEPEVERVLAMESVSEGGMVWVLISLEGGVFSPDPDTTEERKHNLASVPYL
jgi:hypothetical protein